MVCKIKWLKIFVPIGALGLLSVGASPLAQPPGVIYVRLSKVENEVAPDTLRAGDTIRFHIMYGATDTCHYNVSNALRVYSRATLTSGDVGSGSATWVTAPPANRRFGIQFYDGASYGVQVDTTGFLKKSALGQFYRWNCYSCDGAGSDTVAFGGAGSLSPAINGPDSGVVFVMWVVTNIADAGKVICVDSCQDFRTSSWKWPGYCGPYSDWAFPTWSGARCFVLAAKSCCIGQTGNVDCSVDRNVDIGDVTALVDHLYLSAQALCCAEQANCDGKPGVDIGDLTALIDYLYISFAETAACQ
jgi:hypothetical protein